MKPFLSFLLAVCTLSAAANVPGYNDYMAAVYYDGASVPSYNGADSNHRVTIKVTPGSYPGGLIQNLRHTVIDFTGSNSTVSFNIGSLLDVKIIGLFGHDCTTQLWNWHGHNEDVWFDHNRYESVEGDVHEASYNQVYNGSTSSLIFLRFHETNFYARGCGKMMQGSWGGASTGVCFSDSVEFSNGYIYNTAYNGTLVRGGFLHGGWHNNVTKYDSNGTLNPVLGDVGLWYAWGSLTMYGNLMWGGRGYDYRLWPTSLNGVLFKSQIFNNVHMNTHTYGGGNPAWDDANGSNRGTYTATGGSIYVWNNTYANMGDNIGYWTPGLVVGGGIPAGTKVYYHFNYVLNALEGNYSTDQLNKPKQVVDQANGSLQAALDSGGNLYQKVSLGLIDQTNGKKLVPVTAGANVGAVVVTPPVVIPPAGVVCNYDSAIRVYLAAHPCPTCPAPVVCPICPTPTQRTAVSITLKAGAWTVLYSDGTSTTL